MIDNKMIDFIEIDNIMNVLFGIYFQLAPIA